MTRARKGGLLTRNGRGDPNTAPQREAGSVEPVDVIFVSMPFGPLTTPSLGLSLLKASIAPLGVSRRTIHFTIKFAGRIGPDLYTQIVNGAYAFQALIGEWIFSGALFGEVGTDTDGYVRDVLRGGAPEHSSIRPATDSFIRGVLEARRCAADFVSECCREVTAHRPRLVCFTSVFHQQTASLALAKRLKERVPDTFMLFGGANCEGVMGVELIKQFPFIDAVVSGEGDLVFPALARRILHGQPIEGLDGVLTSVSVRGETGTTTQAPVVRDLDALPFPDFDDFFEQGTPFFEKHEDLPVSLLFETSRGCWWGERHHCTFCGLNGKTMAFRSKSPDRALDELRYLAERHPGLFVSVVDNILDMKYFQDFVPALAELDLGLELFYEVKANLKKDQLELLRDAGITTICPGVESLSTEILSHMRKGVTALQNVQLLKWCKQVGLEPFWNLLWGFPGEDPEEYARMSELIPLLTHLHPPFWVLPIRLDRFSPYFEDPESFGIDRIYPYPAYSYVYPTLDADAVANLAYYFTADPKTLRPGGEHAGKLGREIARWRAIHESSDLVAIDDGTRLKVFDTRPVATQSLTELTGIARFLYSECDAIRSGPQLARRARDQLGIDLSPSEPREILQPLLRGGLMLEEDGKLLSLAVVTEDYVPTEAVLVQFLSALGTNVTDADTGGTVPRETQPVA